MPGYFDMRVLYGLALAIFLAGSANAASTFSGLPAASEPLGSGNTAIPLDQGAGCASQTTPCATVQAPQERVGQPIQAPSGCPAAITSPFLYQPCIDTSTSPSVLRSWFGGAWQPIGAYDTANGIWTPPVGGGAMPNIAAATTTDLCAGAPQATVQVTGIATINSFGTTCPRGVLKYVVWQSTPTIVYNASSLILPGAMNITPSAGDIWLVEALGSGNWQLFFLQSKNGTGVSSFNGRTGAVVPQTGDYSFSQISGTVAPGQLPQPMAPIGARTNLSAGLASPNTSVVVTADQIVVGTSLGGISYDLGNFNQTFNSTGTGAGGMDFGALPSNSTVCIYAIYNAGTSAQGIMGTLCSTSSGTIYGGVHMPSGYTASALLGSWSTNGSPALIAGAITQSTAFVIGTSVTSQAPIGAGVNLNASLGSPSASVTLSIDQIIVGTSLTGQTYRLGNYSQTFNGATTGAGGMDTGSLPSNGCVALYAIYNPITNAQSVLGVNCVTSANAVYSGSNMPAGYTASGILVKWATNSTPQLIAGGSVPPFPYSVPLGYPIVTFGKTAFVTNTITFAGTDGTTWTGPTASATLLSSHDSVLTGTPSDPSGTTSTSYVQMGIGSTCTLTNTITSRMLITINGQINNSTAGDGASAILSIGTGTAPINGAAAAGSLLGNPTGINVAAETVPFSLTAIATGLTPLTAYWVDLQVKAVTGGTAIAGSLTCTLHEM